MSRWIDADALAYIVVSNGDVDFINKVTRLMIEAPSIDIVRCGECKYSEKTSSPITALWCKRFGLKDMAVEADDYCSYGQKGDENVETD